MAEIYSKSGPGVTCEIMEYDVWEGRDVKRAVFLPSGSQVTHRIMGDRRNNYRDRVFTAMVVGDQLMENGKAVRFDDWAAKENALTNIMYSVTVLLPGAGHEQYLADVRDGQVRLEERMREAARALGYEAVARLGSRLTDEARKTMTNTGVDAFMVEFVLQHGKQQSGQDGPTKDAKHRVFALDREVAYSRRAAHFNQPLLACVRVVMDQNDRIVWAGLDATHLMAKPTGARIARADFH